MKRIGCFDLHDRTETPSIQIDSGFSVIRLALSHDERVLAAATWDGKIRLFDTESNQQIDEYDEHRSWVTGLLFSPDDSLLYSISSDQSIVAYDPQRQASVARLLGHESEIWGVDISPDGKTLVSAAGYGGSILKWDLQRAIQSERGARQRLMRVIYPMRDKLLCLQSSSNTIDDFDVASGQLTHGQMPAIAPALKNDEIEQLLAVSPDLRWVVAKPQNDSTWWVFDASTGELSVPLTGRFESSPRAVFSEHGQFLLVASDHAEVVLWNTKDWTSHPIWDRGGRLERDSRGAFFSPDSKQVVILLDRRVVVVDRLTKEIIFEKELRYGCYCAAVSHDGKTLATGSGDGIIRLWDLRNEGAACRELRGHVAGVWLLDFSPDDLTLASYADDRKVKLWNPNTAREFFTLHTCQDQPLGSLRFSSDGEQLVGTLTRTDFHSEDLIGSIVWDALRLESQN